MKEAVLLNPARERGEEKRLQARQLTRGEVEDYKQLGLVFACAGCHGRPVSNGEERSPRPEMEWRAGHHGAGGKWFSAHFAAAAGSLPHHHPACPVRMAHDQKKLSISGSPKDFLERGYPSIGYLNVRPRGYAPYRFTQHEALSAQHEGLHLTRSAPSIEEKKGQAGNRVVPFPIRNMKDFFKWTRAVVRHQNGSLHAALISHGGGARSLLGSLFDPSDPICRTRLMHEAALGWKAIGLMQQTGDRRNAPTCLALHPFLMQIIPAREELSLAYVEGKNGEDCREEDRMCRIRGTGGVSGDLGVLTHDVVCSNIALRRQIMEALTKGKPAYAFVTPVVERSLDQQARSGVLNMALHIMGDDMVHLGPLPPAVASALKQEYRRGDWLRGFQPGS